MPTVSPTDNAASTDRTERTGLRAAWARLVDSVLPTPDADRLVRVTEVSRPALPLVEGGLADVSITPILREVPTMSGSSRFVVLVPAKDFETASEVLAGI